MPERTQSYGVHEKRLDAALDHHPDEAVFGPVVHFTSQNGEAVEFVSSTGSNPPSYSRGERVEVLYQPEEPQNAKINSFFSLWGGPVILGGLGGVFFLVGAGLVFAGAREARKDESLKRNGMPIEGDFQSVVINRSLAVNGRHPFRVMTQWQNPMTSEVHIFESNDVWFDPSAYIKGSKIRVFVDKHNPRKYYVDLSFLPKLVR